MSQAGPAPQIRLLGVVPRSVLAELHAFFNTNKAFLLPTAMPAIEKLRELYADNAPCHLLVVGHADTAGSGAYNDKLSLERARSMIAFLKDDINPWLAFYDNGVEQQKRWGKVEDHLMITAMPDFASKPKGEDPVRWFQRTRGLTVDGKPGTQTRTQLITEYMALDGTSLAELHGEIDAIAHGCGENFPLDARGEALDPAPADDQPDGADRRVELFFFDPDFGIRPAPPGDNSGPGSSEYPKWRERVTGVVKLEAGDPDLPAVLFAEIADAHFRTNSAVVLPEGEAPDPDTHQSLTSVGVFATVLRFNEENPGRTLVVAGHTDTTADPDFNQALSEERAGVALALLIGDRDSFVRLCNGRYTVGDIKQILSWTTKAFAGLTFDCDPQKIDDNAATLPVPVRGFQLSFNQNKAALGSNAADLTADGSVGPLTWGAIFDCYEFALQQELGENAQTLADLRGKVQFADPDHPSLGFSEYFPIDELGVDNFRSVANRRVEIVLFNHGEEPDLAHDDDDPETSELYLPGTYEREPLPQLQSARRLLISFKLTDHLGFPMRNTPLTLQLADADIRLASTDTDGLFSEKVPVGLTAITLDDGRMVDFSGSYADYKHDPVNELSQLTDDADLQSVGPGTQEMTVDDFTSSMTALALDDVTPLP